jgi:hypothetical protein
MFVIPCPKLISFILVELRTSSSFAKTRNNILFVSQSEQVFIF